MATSVTGAEGRPTPLELTLPEDGAIRDLEGASLEDPSLYTELGRRAVIAGNNALAASLLYTAAKKSPLLKDKINLFEMAGDCYMVSGDDLSARWTFLNAFEIATSPEERARLCKKAEIDRFSAMKV